MRMAIFILDISQALICLLIFLHVLRDHFANKEAFEKFKMSFDFYSRTSYPEHHKLAKEFFAYYLKNNNLIEKEEAQFYDEKAKMFLPDRYVEGTCPNCGYDKARGDQCDNCGAYYNQTELINPKSIISNVNPTPKTGSKMCYSNAEVGCTKD